jgi:hypothetical protein
MSTTALLPTFDAVRALYLGVDHAGVQRSGGMTLRSETLKSDWLLISTCHLNAN